MGSEVAPPERSLLPGRKPALLLACVDRTLAGDDDVPLAERAEFTAALARPSAAAIIEAFGRALAQVAVRSNGLLVAFEDAAAVDASTAELWAAAEQHRQARPGSGRIHLRRGTQQEPAAVGRGEWFA